MTQKILEHQPTIYRPEDIQYHGEEPYLEIILGQMVLELVLKNVGSDTEPIWIAWFDPMEEKTKKAGTSALVEMIGKLENVSFALTPSSSKSGPMITEACNQAKLPVLTLLGSKDLSELEDKVSSDQKIYSYYPITSPEKPKYMAFPENSIMHIQAAVKSGEGLAIIDDVYSTGATVKAILEGLKDILGEELYKKSKIEVISVAREGVLLNGEAVPEVEMDQNILYDVFIPEIIGDLNSAIYSQPKK